MAVINIDDAYILNETGAQVDKVTGLFTKDEDTTSGEKAFAQLNIGTAGSNRNLLDNPFFQVNQRGVTSGTITNAEVVGPDRWHLFQCSWSVANNAITLAWGGGGTAAGFLQRTGPEVGYALVGKTCTISAYINGTLYTKTVEIKEPAYAAQDLLLGGGVNIRVITDALSGNRGVEVQFRTTSTTNVTIGPVKFELGSVSTLANDAPPDYAEELRKCQYYYREWSITSAGGFAIAWPWSNANATIMNIFGIGNEMRTKSPVITWSGSWTVRTQGGANIAITNISKADSPTALGIDITVASGLTNNQPCRVTADSGAKITFSANI